MQINNAVMIPPEIESHLSPEARETARYMSIVPSSDGGCQFEIHAGGADVEIVIDTSGAICAVSFQRTVEQIAQ